MHGPHSPARAGPGWRNWAGDVAGLELVLADGTIADCSPARPGGIPGLPDPVSLLDAARVGLGALAVVTAVTFRVVPAFLLEAREQLMRWSEVIARLDELTADNEHFEFYWFPHSAAPAAGWGTGSPPSSRR